MLSLLLFVFMFMNGVTVVVDLFAIGGEEFSRDLGFIASVE